MANKSRSVRPTVRSITKSRSDGNGNAIHNKILLGLPQKERNFVFSKLKLITLGLGDVVQEAGQPIKFGYFPNTAMASLLSIMSDGKCVEVGLAGNEGFVGLPLLAGLRTHVNRINAQAEGTAFRIAPEDLNEALGECPKLTRALMRYSQEATMQLTQIAACNRLHEVDERLARWLLMCHDRIGGDALPLTQDFLAQMLGTRRASVSVSAAILQKARLIKYSRGHVEILNRPGLEEASCECYDVMRRNIETWNQESM